MVKQGYIATVQIVIPKGESNGRYIRNLAEAVDEFRAILSENLKSTSHLILDWQYVSIGSQTLGPQPCLYDDEEERIF